VAVIGLTITASACGSGSGAVATTTESTPGAGATLPSTTAISRTSSTLPAQAHIVTANYSDTAGDTWGISMGFGPIEVAAEVPPGVVTACNDVVNFDPQRSLWLHVSGVLTLTSSLATSLFLEPPDGAQQQLNSNGTTISQPASATVYGNDSCQVVGNMGWLNLPELSENSSDSFDFWILYEDVITVAYPHGNLALIQPLTFYFPGIGTQEPMIGGSISSVTGSNAFLCTASDGTATFSPLGNPLSNVSC
jgi:hypothetical protein